MLYFFLIYLVSLGKNPRPICVPVPRLPFIRACVRFYNIYFQGRNIHLCLNMEGKFRDTTLFKVRYENLLREEYY